MSHDFIEVIRRTAQEVVAARAWKGTLVTTGYDKETRSIKGIIVPHGVETGWIPLSVMHAGNNYGIGVGPKCGSKEALDGDVFDIEFDNGDPNTPVAKMQHHSEQDNPPPIESGEILINHQSGMKDKFSKDGSRTATHPNGATDQWDPTGNKIKDLKGLSDKIIAGTVLHDTPKQIITGIMHLATG